MGAHWLLGMPNWLQNAGLNVQLWPGWQTRSRSSGGYDDIRGIGIHHDAVRTGTSLNNRCSYAWNNSSIRPIGALWLHTDGTVMVGAAGATNTQGRGGPYATSRGTIPLDAGNRYMVSIEASNNGVGEKWPAAQQEAYVVLCKTLVDRLGLQPRDVVAHFEWTGRKIDPWGPSKYAGNGKWNMSSFRADVQGTTTPPPTKPPPGGYNPPTEWGLYPLDKAKPWVGTGQYGEATKGQHVRYLQDVIYFKAGGDIVRDGQFGPQTKGRVEDLQRLFGLKVTGSVNHGGQHADDTWAVVDALALDQPVEPEPPEPPPSQNGVTGVEPCRYYVRSGDGPWSAAERCYGNGALWVGNFTSSQFAEPNVHIPAKGTKGKRTKVRSGEGPYKILDRMNCDRGRLQTFYDWNGGEKRILHEGDVVFMPTS